MRDFPKKMIEATENKIFWESAKRLLHVTPADKIGDPVYTGLQHEIDERLKERIKNISTAEYSEPGPLAVGRGSPTSILRFNKFSTPGPLLRRYELQQKATAKDEGKPLDMLLNCVVHKLGGLDDGKVHTIETSRGTISWQGEHTQVVLCAGVCSPLEFDVNGHTYQNDRPFLPPLSCRIASKVVERQSASELLVTF